MTGISWLSSEVITTVAMFTALLLDRVLGEPARFHPLIGFGKIAQFVEGKIRTNPAVTEKQQGIIAWAVAVVIPTLFFMLVAICLSLHPVVYILVSGIILYLTLGGRSLTEHAIRVAEPLSRGELDDGRRQVAMIVSRHTDNMSEQEICSATVESVLENGNDAVIGPLIWFLIAGLPGAVMFRLTNTLDAMWGYKNERYLSFGWCAAKADDLMGWLPARVTALLYLVQGNIRQGRECWKTQAGQCKSPNGGIVMTAGAGAMDVTIGGPARYHGRLEQKPRMGAGPDVKWPDIARACQLVERAAWLLALCVFLFSWIG